MHELELAFWSPFPMVSYLLSLDMGGGAWSSPKLVCQTLLTPQGKPYLLRGMDGRWEKGREKVKEGELGLVCKMKRFFFLTKKKVCITRKTCFTEAPFFSAIKMAVPKSPHKLKGLGKPALLSSG